METGKGKYRGESELHEMEEHTTARTGSTSKGLLEVAGWAAKGGAFAACQQKKGVGAADPWGWC